MPGILSGVCKLRTGAVGRLGLVTTARRGDARVDGTDHEDDRLLARRIVAGDRAAFRSLFDLYFPRLYRYARARLAGEREDVRDVVQQTFCRAIEKLGTYRGEAALFTWFCQICNRLILDRQRARGIEARRLVHFEDSPQVQAVLDALTSGAADRPEFEAWRGDVGRLVQATLDRLPERHAKVLEWKYVEELSVEDIARRLAVAPKAAESVLTRARQSFRAAIGTMLHAEDALAPPGLQ